MAEERKKRVEVHGNQSVSPGSDAGLIVKRLLREGPGLGGSEPAGPDPCSFSWCSLMT